MTSEESSIRPTSGFSRDAASSSWSNARVFVSAFEPVGLPLDALGVESTRARSIRLADRILSDVWPTMFGYQFIIESTPVRT